MNLEHGDLGTFAYNCVSGAASFKCGEQRPNNGGNVYGGTNRWASEFVSNLTGGGPLMKELTAVPVFLTPCGKYIEMQEHLSDQSGLIKEQQEMVQE